MVFGQSNFLVTPSFFGQHVRWTLAGKAKSPKPVQDHAESFHRPRKMAMLGVIFAAILSVTCGLKIKLLEPSENTMWVTGNDVELFWKIEDSSNAKDMKTIELNLMQGRNKRPELVDNIAFGVEYKHGDAFWTVKEKLPTGDDYFIRIISPEDNDFIYDSPFFTVKNAPKGIKKASNCNAAPFLASPSKIVGLAACVLTCLAFL